VSARKSKTKKVTYKACTRCRYIVPSDVKQCPVCGSTTFTDNWKGMVIVIDPEKSEIAKIIGAKVPGRYAIRV